MEENHFNNPAGATSDTMLRLCVQQSYVPPACLLGGQIVLGLVNAGKNPCSGCRGPRHVCGGRPFLEADDGGRRLSIGTSVQTERSGAVRAFFLGGDCAPSESHRSDDGSLVIGMAWPRDPQATWETLSDNEADWWFAYVWARTLTSVERASARQWSGLIHQLHSLYAFEKIVLDPGGGGIYVQREMKSPKQFYNGAEREVTPIADQVNGPRDVTRGYFILHLYKRGDPGMEMLWPELAGDDMLNDAAYSDMKQAIDHAGVMFPPKLDELKTDRPDEVRTWTPERLAALDALNRMVDQFKNIVVATKESGDGTTFAMTKRGARQYSAQGKKDLMSGGMYCYLGFRIWLRSEDWKNTRRVGGLAMFSGG